MTARRKIAFHTFGCKLNFAETSTIGRILPAEDFELVDISEKADVYVIHSCTVTEAAEKKCNQFIRHLKRENPGSTLAVMGCYAEMKPDKLRAMPEVDLVLGNDQKFDLGRHLQQMARNEQQDKAPMHDVNNEFILSYSLHDRTRSFLKIQDGCDYYCAYCTIPFARGRSRSPTIESLLETAGRICDEGIKEIVLTGVNIGDFGKPDHETLYDLLWKMDKILPIPRIRISSIEPDLLTDSIIDLISSSGKLMPHFHIPLQSGSDRILTLMKRKYRGEHFAGRLEKIKKVMPHACIAADVIVGFPGETEDDFDETFTFVEDLDISYMHVFTYSERPGTKAVLMEGKVPAEIKKGRSKRLHALSEIKKRHFYDQNAGRNFNVLFESDPNKTELFGFTENYIHVKADFDHALVNEIVLVKLNKQDDQGSYFIMKNEE
ncbi:MAG TPA: tRNA (N(6)-L-threonylcarbamoyladenosine(37)-C(2))-methylthiotransferase MtaB [Bacteroidales bacterium]|nr:tRNA (N(6)-L-threonylcarbamoyladenosine(37)-C(2))-methylthiotransferase MtaB [Bacteroidales bacterium]HRZ20547.1 tRNA (N(6)-L-threonylcarbamoyladenosine(37)-C(2))-methylthiotransferase MtaB [Bacteroidales bacterium]